VGDVLAGERVHAQPTVVLAALQPRQLALVGLRERLAGLADLALDEMEIVEQPLRRGRHRLVAAHRGDQAPVSFPKDPFVLGEAVEERPADATTPVDLVAPGERAGVLREPVGAEDLVPDRIERPSRSWVDGSETRTSADGTMESRRKRGAQR
jgi:hypothetical protein